MENAKNKYINKINVDNFMNKRENVACRAPPFVN